MNVAQRVIASLTLLVLLAGTFVLSVLAWPIGWVLLWLSPRWSVREKLIGTCIPLEVSLGLYGGMWALGTETGQAPPSALVIVAVVIVMIALAAVALVSTARLAHAVSK